MMLMMHAVKYCNVDDVRRPQSIHDKVPREDMTLGSGIVMRIRLDALSKVRRGQPQELHQLCGSMLERRYDVIGKMRRR